VPSVNVNPAHIQDLRDSLKEAKKHLETAFEAPSKAKFTFKLGKNHGLTSLEGVLAIGDVLNGQRKDARDRMRVFIDACDKALEQAAAMYKRTDESGGESLKNQVDTGS